MGYLSVKHASFSLPPKSTGSKIGTMSLGSRGDDHCSCFLDIKVHLKANMHGASCQTMSQRGEAASGSGHDGALAATVLAGLERVLLHRLVSFLWYCTPNSGSPLRIFFFFKRKATHNICRLGLFLKFLFPQNSSPSCAIMARGKQMP